MTTYYAPGEWNFICDLCGDIEKSSNGRKTWDNFYVCARHKETRNPQDFVRGVRDNQTVPWTRSRAVDAFVVSTFRLLQENGAAILQEVDSFGTNSNLLVT